MTNDDGNGLPRRTPGEHVPGWPFAPHMTCPDVPEDPRIDCTYEQFTEDEGVAGRSPRMWDAWSWWLRSGADPGEDGASGDRLTIGRYAGPPFVSDVRPERFVVLTSSRPGGVDLGELFGHTESIGEAVTFSRDELVRLGRWLVETFDADAERPGGFVGEADDPRGVTARLAKGDHYERLRRATRPPASDREGSRTPREVLARLDTGNDDPGRIGPAGLAAVAQVLADMGGDSLEPYTAALNRAALWAYEGDAFSKRAVTAALSGMELEARAEVIRNSARLRRYGAELVEPVGSTETGNDDDDEQPG